MGELGSSILLGCKGSRGGLGWLKLSEGYEWGKGFFEFVFRGVTL